MTAPQPPVNLRIIRQLIVRLAEEVEAVSAAVSAFSREYCTCDRCDEAAKLKIAAMNKAVR